MSASGFLLDTNVVSEALRSRPDKRGVAWLREYDARSWLWVVTIGELEHVLRATLRLAEERIAAVREALVTPDPVPRPPEPDPLTVDDKHDAWVVATAVRGGADVLVAGDAALPAAAPNAALADRFSAVPKR